jgi:hypothetical protein
MEQIIVIAVFAICASVCVKILVVSYLMTEQAVETRHALSVAESAADGFKAYGGDLERVFAILGGADGQYIYDDALTVYYDSDWNPTEKRGAAFALHVARSQGSQNLILADISVIKVDKNRELVSFTAAVRKEVAAWVAAE